jgi:hypothetical protein
MSIYILHKYNIKRTPIKLPDDLNQHELAVYNSLTKIRTIIERNINYWSACRNSKINESLTGARLKILTCIDRMYETEKRFEKLSHEVFKDDKAALSITESIQCPRSNSKNKGDINLDEFRIQTSQDKLDLKHHLQSILMLFNEKK